MFLNRSTFHRDKDFEKKNDVVKIIAKTGLKHFRWSVSIIQTSKLNMDLYFQNDVPDS